MGLTIIVLVHNERENAIRCINSIREYADVGAFNVILADNHSTDGLSEWASEQEDFTYVYMDEGIVPYGMILNQITDPKNGLEILEHVFIMNCRLLLTERSLSLMSEVLSVHDDTGVVGCLSDGFVSPLQIATMPETGETEVYAVVDDAVMVKKDIMERIGFFQSDMWTMMRILQDFAVRLLQNGIKSRVSRQAFMKSQRSLLEEPEDILIHMNDDDEILRRLWGVQYLNLIGNDGIVELIEEPAGKELHVLEIGCDCGATLFDIQTKFPNARIHGCDINEEAVKITALSMNAFTANIEDKEIPFENLSLDYVILADVLEHLHDPLGTIQYISKKLKPGGCILASVPNLMHISVIKQILRGEFSYTETGLLDRTHVHFFTYKEMVKMFETAGYTIERTSITTIAEDDGDDELIGQLVALGENAEAFMYHAFQYVFRARKISF